MAEIARGGVEVEGHGYKVRAWGREVLWLVLYVLMILFIYWQGRHQADTAMAMANTRAQLTSQAIARVEEDHAKLAKLLAEVKCLLGTGSEDRRFLLRVMKNDPASAAILCP